MGSKVRVFWSNPQGFAWAKASLPWQTQGLSSDNASFIKDKDSFTLANLLAMAKRKSSSNSKFFLLSFLPFLCLLFFQCLQNISKLVISVIFKNMGVNLAFRLHRHMKNMLQMLI